MTKQQLRSNLLLLLGAAIWGFAFVAQRVGMRYIGAFTFNGVRFALGALSLLPLLALQAHQTVGEPAAAPRGRHARLHTLLSGGLLGCVLFSAASLQQIGLYTTTAGKAGFITGMYILLVPVFGIFFGRKNPPLTWVSVLIATAGLYLISVTGAFTIAPGDLYELAGACLFAVHIMMVDVLSKRIPALKLSLMQFVTCSALSLLTAAFTERISFSGILAAAVPLLYGGILSVGVAYTLQIVGQKHAQPAVASILMSFESVFSCIGGILLLHETLGLRGTVGCLLMVAGMILSQAEIFRRRKPAG
jgi:drug/metabolite transporter (DMT)-like permease